MSNDELQDHTFEIAAIRVLVVQLYGEKLARLKNPKKGA